MRVALSRILLKMSINGAGTDFFHWQLRGSSRVSESDAKKQARVLAPAAAAEVSRAALPTAALAAMSFAVGFKFE